MNNEMMETFFNDQHARFSKETTRGYRIALNQFFSFCAKPYDQIKATEIRIWLNSMEERGLKPRSVHLKLSAVKSFYRYCMEENKLKKNPALIVKTPKIDDALPYYISRKQVTILH